MTVPLVVLAAGAVVSGFIGLPPLFTGGNDWNVLHRFLHPVVVELPGGVTEGHEMGVALEWGLVGVAVAVAGLGIWLAWITYGRNRGLERGRAWAARFPWLHRLLVNKYYVDELYDATVVRGTWGTAHGLHRFDAGVIDGIGVHGARNLTVTGSLLSGFFDKYVVDGLVNGVGSVLSLFSRGFRRLQTGYVGNYALVLAAGVFALVCAWALLRRF